MLAQGGAQAHTTLRGKFDGIADQVEEHLLEPQGIALQPMRQGRVKGQLQRQAFVLCFDKHQLGDLAQQGG